MRLGAISFRPQQHQPDGFVLEAQPQQRIVQLARGADSPAVRALGERLGGVLRKLTRRRTHGQRGDTLPGVELDRDVPVLDAPRRDARLQSVQLDPGSARDVRSLGRERLHALLDGVGELAPRHDGVDESPFDRALPFDAFRKRGERVGEIAPYLSLVDDARESARAGQHAEQRNLGQ